MGGRIAEAAGSLLGLELQGLSPQDQEFESARQFVRFASSAAQQAALAPPSIAPETAAQAAATAAAHTFAPGIAHEIRVGFRGFRPGYRHVGYRPGYRYHGYARPGVYRGGAWRGGWRPGYAHYGWRPGYHHYGWRQGPMGIPVDWARYRAFLGEAPPPPPSGAPGNWVFGGFRHGRRRWSWIPVPGAPPFVVAPPVEPGPPDAMGLPPLPVPDFGAPPAIGPDAGQPPGAFGAPAGPGQPPDPSAGAAPGGAAPGAPEHPERTAASLPLEPLPRRASGTDPRPAGNGARRKEHDDEPVRVRDRGLHVAVGPSRAPPLGPPSLRIRAPLRRAAAVDGRRRRRR